MRLCCTARHTASSNDAGTCGCNFDALKRGKKGQEGCTNKAVLECNMAWDHRKGTAHYELFNNIHSIQKMQRLRRCNGAIPD